MKDARYFLTILLKTSTWALHWGWAGVVLVCWTLSKANSSLESLLTNSFPQSVWIYAGMPNLQNHSLKMAFAIISASLFSTAVTSMYFVNASVMHRMYLCWRPAASIGPNRSVWIQTFGLSGFGSGWSGGGLSVDFFCHWHRRHVLVWFSMSDHSFGQ